MIQGVRLTNNGKSALRLQLKMARQPLYILDDAEKALPKISQRAFELLACCGSEKGEWLGFSDLFSRASEAGLADKFSDDLLRLERLGLVLIFRPEDKTPPEVEHVRRQRVVKGNVTFGLSCKECGNRFTLYNNGVLTTAPPSHCPFCGSQAVAAAEHTPDYWESLAVLLGIQTHEAGVNLVKELYNMWDPTEHAKFPDFVDSIRKEASNK